MSNLTKALRKRQIRGDGDGRRLAHERETYGNARPGDACPRCRDIWDGFRRDLEQGHGMGAYVVESCWLCHNTDRVGAEAAS
jgi:hypothetical protein